MSDGAVHKLSDSGLRLSHDPINCLAICHETSEQPEAEVLGLVYAGPGSVNDRYWNLGTSDAASSWAAIWVLGGDQ